MGTTNPHSEQSRPDWTRRYFLEVIQRKMSHRLRSIRNIDAALSYSNQTRSARTQDALRTKAIKTSSREGWINLKLLPARFDSSSARCKADTETFEETKTCKAAPEGSTLRTP